ncbi:hypothetical protein ACFVAJ_17640 [Agromyces sp. NPDC057679]|uniref:hypothetical protein n=1 Tax=Agromyces sp. NPDC057679 TaxID=3346207 RepID=UPI00366CF201
MTNTATTSTRPAELLEFGDYFTVEHNRVTTTYKVHEVTVTTPAVDGDEATLVNVSALNVEYELEEMFFAGGEEIQLADDRAVERFDTDSEELHRQHTSELIEKLTSVMHTVGVLSITFALMMLVVFKGYPQAQGLGFFIAAGAMTVTPLVILSIAGISHLFGKVLKSKGNLRAGAEGTTDEDRTDG